MPIAGQQNIFWIPHTVIFDNNPLGIMFFGQRSQDSYGEIDDLGEEDLPYDLEESHLALKDHTYAIWYLDPLSIF